MKKKNGFTLIELLIIPAILAFIAFGLLAFTGWGLNVYKLCCCDFKAPFKSEIVRGIGVAVPPVGCITGFMKLPDIDTEE